MDDLILDTHLHLVDRVQLRYPWLLDVPTLNHDWPLASYASEAHKLGIGGALHMEVDVADDLIEQETTWIEEQTPNSPIPILGIIAACRPEAPGFEAFLERNTDRVVGFRRPLHVVPDETSQTPDFRANVARLAKAGHVFDLCVTAGQLPLAIGLADAAPSTQMVLDHCGVPDIAGDAWDAWAGHIADLAQRPNVCVKISGVIAYGGDNWHLQDLHRWVNHTVTCFGIERVCWGGDWPVCTLGGGLAIWVAATRALTAGWSADDRAALFHKNARRIWRL